MVQRVARDSDSATGGRPRRKARKDGVSMEETHHRILRAALAPAAGRAGFKAFLASCPDVGEDRDFARIPQPERQVAP